MVYSIGISVKYRGIAIPRRMLSILEIVQRYKENLGKGIALRLKDV